MPKSAKKIQIMHIWYHLAALTEVLPWLVPHREANTNPMGGGFSGPQGMQLVLRLIKLLCEESAALWENASRMLL